MRTATISNRSILLLCELALASIAVSPCTAQQATFRSQPVTPAGEYTFGIEGPAVDDKGNLYVVNFGKQGTIGILAAGSSQSQLFATLPEGSIGNAIRFDREGRMFVADYRKHNIFLIGSGGTTNQNYFSFGGFNQPNDIMDHGGWSSYPHGPP